jgi:hypothetical protein
VICRTKIDQKGEVVEQRKGEPMSSTCPAVAKWAIAPYADANKAALSCDNHLLPFLESWAGAEGRGVEEIHVYPIVLEKRGPLCRHKIEAQNHQSVEG